MVGAVPLDTAEANTQGHTNANWRLIVGMLDVVEPRPLSDIERFDIEHRALTGTATSADCMRLLATLSQVRTEAEEARAEADRMAGELREESRRADEAEQRYEALPEELRHIADMLEDAKKRHQDALQAANDARRALREVSIERDNLKKRKSRRKATT